MSQPTQEPDLLLCSALAGHSQQSLQDERHYRDHQESLSIVCKIYHKKEADVTQPRLSSVFLQVWEQNQALRRRDLQQRWSTRLAVGEKASKSEGACGEVGSRNVLHEFGRRDVSIFNQSLKSSSHFANVVWRNLCCHRHCNALQSLPL